MSQDNPETGPEPEGAAEGQALPLRRDDGTGAEDSGQCEGCGNDYDPHHPCRCRDDAGLPPVQGSLCGRAQDDVPRLGCKTPLSAGRALAGWSTYNLAYAIHAGLVTDWPHEFTRAGWRWLRRSSSADQEAAP